MHQPQRRYAIGIAQIIVETADLCRQQQALVHHRAGGTAGKIGIGQTGQAVLFGKLGERVLHLFADGQQLAFKGVLIGAVRPARDDRHFDHRH